MIHTLNSKKMSSLQLKLLNQNAHLAKTTSSRTEARTILYELKPYLFTIFGGIAYYTQQFNSMGKMSSALLLFCSFIIILARWTHRKG